MNQCWVSTLPQLQKWHTCGYVLFAHILDHKSMDISPPNLKSFDAWIPTVYWIPGKISFIIITRKWKPWSWGWLYYWKGACTLLMSASIQLSYQMCICARPVGASELVLWSRFVSRSTYVRVDEKAAYTVECSEPPALNWQGLNIGGNRGGMVRIHIQSHIAWVSSVALCTWCEIQLTQFPALWVVVMSLCICKRGTQAIPTQPPLTRCRCWYKNVHVNKHVTKSFD